MGLAKPHDDTSAERKLSYAFWLAIVPAALLLSFLALGRESLFIDETASLAFTRLPWSDFWHLVVTREANQSLYYLLLRPWLVFGETEFALRSLSALFAAASIPVMFGVARRLFDTRVAVVASSLLALNALFIRVGQEARGYSLVIFLSLCSTYLFVAAYQRPTRARLILYVLLGAAGIYAHLYGALVIAAHFAGALAAGRDRWPLKRCAQVFGSMGLLACPLFLFVLTRNSGQLSWIERPGPGTLPTLLALLSGGRQPVIGALLALSWLGLCGVALSRLMAGRPATEAARGGGSGQRWKYALLLVWFLLPTVGAFTLSLVKPILQFKYATVAIPALLLMGSAGIMQVRHPLLRRALLVLIILATGQQTLVQYVESNNEDWRAATETIVQRAQPDDAIAFVPPYLRLPFGVYVQRLDTAASAPASMSRDFSWERDALDQDITSGRLAVYPRAMDRRLAALPPVEAERLWLVFSFTEPEDRELAEDSIGTSYDQVEELDFTDVQVVLYRRR